MEKSEKEYGKLSLDQFKFFAKKLPEIRNKMEEPTKLMRSTPEDEMEEIIDAGLSWANIYECSFNEQLALLICALGRASKLHEAAKSNDPTQAAIDMFKDDEFDDWNGGEGGVFQKKDVIGLTVALKRNILAMMLFHRTLDKMVEDVRAGKDESFFQAVCIDRSIVTCSTFADRIAKAELENEKDFFDQLSVSLKGPSKKHWEAYKDLRYVFCILRELGFDQMSDAQLEDLFVHKLKLYPDMPGAQKNLRKHFTKSKRNQPPQNEI